MFEQETQQLLLEIIERAENRQFTEFRLLISWDEFRTHKQMARANKLIISMLKTSARNLINSYYKNVLIGISDVNELLAWRQLQEIIEFYQKDLETIQKMIDEYDDYLGEGNFWYDAK